MAQVKTISFLAYLLRINTALLAPHKVGTLQGPVLGVSRGFVSFREAGESGCEMSSWWSSRPSTHAERPCPTDLQLRATGLHQLGPLPLPFTGMGGGRCNPARPACQPVHAGAPLSGATWGFTGHAAAGLAGQLATCAATACLLGCARQALPCPVQCARADHDRPGRHACPGFCYALLCTACMCGAWSPRPSCAAWRPAPPCPAPSRPDLLSAACERRT